MDADRRSHTGAEGCAGTSWWGVRFACALALSLLPLLVSIAPRRTSVEPSFRACPYNEAYEWMSVAVGLSFPRADLLSSHPTFLPPPLRARHETPPPPSWAAVICLWPWTQAVISFRVATTAGAGFAWATAAAGVTAACVVASWRSVRLASRSARAAHHSLSSTALRSFLGALSLVFLVPVFAPWDGPVQPFVRWHPFSEAGEALFRGTFLTFAVGCAAAAAQRTLADAASFAVSFTTQCFVHATTMLVLSRTTGPKNTNFEHLPGNIACFYAIGLVLTALLRRNAADAAAASRRTLSADSHDEEEEEDEEGVRTAAAGDDAASRGVGGAAWAGTAQQRGRSRDKHAAAVE